MSYTFHSPMGRDGLTRGGQTPYMAPAPPSAYVWCSFDSSTWTSYRVINSTPLLPMPWPLPTEPLGTSHSTWSWQSPNFSLVTSLPVRGTISIYPFSTFHLVSCGTPPRPCAVHFERSLPSNSTIAS